MTDTSAPHKTVRAAAREGRALQKGQQTKAVIVEAALGLATHIGLEGLSIGALADVTGMSKSGVFAHFGSREELQISVIREYHVRFEQEGVLPRDERSARSGPPARHVRQLDAAHLHRNRFRLHLYQRRGGVRRPCRPGARCALASSVLTWLAAMKRAIEQAKELGQLRADVNPEQMLFEIHGLILALHYEARFLQTPGSIDRANAASTTSWRATACPMRAAAERLRPFFRFHPSVVSTPSAFSFQPFEEPTCPATRRPCATCNS